MYDFKMTKLGRLTASGLITDRGCLIFSMCAIGGDADANFMDLYDGFTTGDKLIMTFGMYRTSADFRNFVTPLYFAKGVYLDFRTNGWSFFIQYADTDE